MLIKKDMPILLSMPRNGSTWVQSYIRASYKSKDGVIPLESITAHSKRTTSNEFFDSEEYPQLDTKEKIHLIETLEKLSLVVCHKVFANMFLQMPDLFKWFQSFYKDYNIILLRRRNIWKTYISLLFHNTFDKHVNRGENLHPWHGRGDFTIENETREDLLKAAIQTYKIPFKFNKQHFADFTRLVRFYQDEVIAAFPDKWQMWLEDLSDEKLAEMFKVEVQTEIAPLKRLNYLTYFEPKELKLIQDTFEERFENEFRFYGYEYK